MQKKNWCKILHLASVRQLVCDSCALLHEGLILPQCELHLRYNITGDGLR